MRRTRLLVQATSLTRAANPESAAMARAILDAVEYRADRAFRPPGSLSPRVPRSTTAAARAFRDTAPIVVILIPAHGRRTSPVARLPATAPAGLKAERIPAERPAPPGAGRA